MYCQPAADLLLKVTPPRVPRHLLTREPLTIGGPRLGGVPALLVQAPAGFGKTSLLAQWRLELLARGACVAWVTCQAQDDASRLLQSLVMAVRAATHRPRFGQDLLARPGLPPLEGVTCWLSELVQGALDVALVLDDVDRMHPSARALLAHLLRHQPANLTVVVSARHDCDLGLDELLSYGHARSLGPAELRFSLAETLQLIRNSLGSGFDLDIGARLHACCEGWPLGLQLLLNQLVSGADPLSMLQSLDEGSSQHPNGLRQRLTDLMFATLSESDLSLLECAAIGEPLHPDLLRSLTGMNDAAERLKRLARNTPLLSVAEPGAWLRLHALARERLLQRLQQRRPAAELADLHGRACAWMQAQGQLDAAACHAWEAGQHEQALELAERGLHEALTQRGQHGLVQRWLQRLPAQAWRQRPRLQLAAAWFHATGENHTEAVQIVNELLAQANITPTHRAECALILGAAALYADAPDRFAALHNPSEQTPPQDTLLRQMHANRSAMCMLLEGEPAAARLRLQQCRQAAPSMRYSMRWSELIQGLSHCGEGQVHHAEAQLASALGRAEAELGRRSSMACMQAAMLAACLCEQGREAEAQTLLADRLDVLERSGLADVVVLGFRTLVHIAAANGAEHQALALLARLDAVGQARGLPRLRIVSLCEQVRLHARHFRGETCKALITELDLLLSEPGLPEGRLWRRSVDLRVELARGLACIAAREWRGAIAPLDAARQAAQELRMGRVQIEAQALRALALDRCGEHGAATLMCECLELANALGLQRVFTDAHPELADWLGKLGAAPQAPAAAESASQAARAPSPAPPAQVRDSTALSAREREVLELLARNFTNKEAALALQLGEETVKWHVKRLFAKLEAGNRRQAVGRARMLGLLPALDARQAG